MKALINKIKAFLADEQGAETVEWVVVVALLVMVAISVYNGILLGVLEGAVEAIGVKIDSAATSTPG